MFAKDFNLLNEIYNQRIFKEDMGLGPNGKSTVGLGADTYTILPSPSCDKCDTCPNCGKPEDECKCHPEEADMVFADEPAHSGYDDRERSAEYEESNARMAKQELFRIAKMSYMLHDLIDDNEELAAWFTDKVSRAYEGMNSIFAYKDYEQYREELEGSYEEVEEGTEGDLINSINRGGENIINQIRRVVRNESVKTVEKVLLECVRALEVKKRKKTI